MILMVSQIMVGKTHSSQAGVTSGYIGSNMGMILELAQVISTGQLFKHQYMHPSYETHHPSDTRHQSLPLPLPEVRNIEDSPLGSGIAVQKGGKQGRIGQTKGNGVQILDYKFQMVEPNDQHKILQISQGDYRPDSRVLSFLIDLEAGMHSLPVITAKIISLA